VRLWEIILPPGHVVKVEATKWFLKDLPSFIREYSNLSKNLEDFIEFRQTNQIGASYNKKDTPFVNPNLRENIRHVHLIHGKVVVFYMMTTDTLYLYTITNHGEYESKSSPSTARLVTRLNNIKSSDFIDFDYFKNIEPPALDPKQLEEINDLLWSMADDESREYLIGATRGKFKELIDFLTDITSIDDPKDLIKALGGEQKLKSVISDILKHTSEKKFHESFMRLTLRRLIG